MLIFLKYQTKLSLIKFLKNLKDKKKKNSELKIYLNNYIQFNKHIKIYLIC